MNTCTRFQHEKRRLFFWRLTREYSKKFKTEAEFRERLLACVEKPRKQIALNLRLCPDITDVNNLEGVHTLDLSCCFNLLEISKLTDIQVLALSLNNITDVSALGGVHKLNLGGCPNIMDVSALGGVHTLNLCRCRNITDVSCLSGVHTMNLTYCYNITGMDALGGVNLTNGYWGIYD